MNFLKKWYTYQKERFPVLIYGLYIFSIVFATFCFACNMGYEKNYKILIPMFIVAFLQFFMVRIVDEFKDYEDDCKYRPYRPVPRGLISLKELKIAFIICLLLQIGITFYINKISIVFLSFVWIFFALMSKSFFIKEILDKHILLEVLFDEIMLPILVLFLATFVFDFKNLIYLNLDWVSLIPMLMMSYFISWIVEVARKVRAKEDEETGVKTYTAVFGIKKATLLLWGLEAIVMLLNIKILNNIYYGICAFIIVSLINIGFIIKQNKKFAKFAELGANVFIMFAYLNLAFLIL